MSGPLLELRGLSVGFDTAAGPLAALDRVDLRIDRGEIVGIIGESGAGKSVAAHAVMGLLGPTARITGGEIRFDGRDLLALDPAARARWRGTGAAMVFQNPRAALNPIRAVGDQIADVIARHHPGSAATLRAATLAALREVGVPDPEQRMSALPHELSGGLCQRICIAIALACRPALLIADEPTTGLDVTTQAVIMDLVAGLARKQAMAVALISHDLALAAEYCDRLVILQQGRVIESGPTARIIAAPEQPYTQALLQAARSRPAGSPPTTTPQTTGLQTTGPLIMARGLKKHFARPGRWPWQTTRSLHAVDGVDLQIAPGEALGLVGESGCGKSTLARLLSRLTDPTAGEILLDGQPVTGQSVAAFARTPARRRLQMVFQDPAGSLNPRFRVRDLIADPARMLLPPEDRADLHRRVAAAAAAVELPAALLDRLPHQLSGGQQARVGIARALVVEPRLIVLDEPTSSLDPRVQERVLQLLDRLRREQGIALLFVSHDLNVVRQLCQRIAVMYLGQVVETGPTEAVFRQPAHPYTRALLSAAPEIGRPRAARPGLQGEPPSPFDPPADRCRLAGRCPAERAACRSTAPDLRPAIPGRLVRCLYPEMPEDKRAPVEGA